SLPMVRRSRPRASWSRGTIRGPPCEDTDRQREVHYLKDGPAGAGLDRAGRPATRRTIAAPSATAAGNQRNSRSSTVRSPPRLLAHAANGTDRLTTNAA